MYSSCFMPCTWSFGGWYRVVCCLVCDCIAAGSSCCFGVFPGLPDSCLWFLLQSRSWLSIPTAYNSTVSTSCRNNSDCRCRWWASVYCNNFVSSMLWPCMYIYMYIIWAVKVTACRARFFFRVQNGPGPGFAATLSPNSCEPSPIRIKGSFTDYKYTV